MPEDIVHWNEEMVQRYDIDRYYERSHPLVRWIERRRIAALVRLATAGERDHVLEVGCGGGHIIERFERSTRTAVDLSSSMLQRARRRLGQAVPLARAAAESLPFPDGVFDVVICTEVLEHTPDPAAVIDEIVRVVRTNGRIVISIPNEHNIDRAKRILRSIPGLRTLLRTLASEANEWHLHSFDRHLLETIVAGRAEIRAVASVPFAGIPARYVVLLSPTRAN